MQILLGYADSTKAPMSEEAFVKDSVQVYKWLRTQTTSKIYVWGLSLGTAVGTETIAQLRDEMIIPMGLILEAPFTTVVEVVATNSIAKVK